MQTSKQALASAVAHEALIIRASMPIPGMSLRTLQYLEARAQYLYERARLERDVTDKDQYYA